MKKILCLTLAVLVMLCVFTGCTGTAYTANGNSRMRAYDNYAKNYQNDQGNVSTSRDGTVNGRNKTSMPRKGMDMKIGSGMR